jgi:fumarate hydratase subunit beta
MPKNIVLPLNDKALEDLRMGDSLLLTGPIYVCRDAVHKKLTETMNKGEQLPLEIKGATIYYMGPSPTRPNRVIGAAGPTTSGRMDSYAPKLIAAGLKGMIGKGMRSQTVKDAMVKYKAVYLGAIGGAGALISSSIVEAKIIAYEELGAEALLLITVKNFPVTVINDIYGGDLYQTGKAKYQVFSNPSI